MPGLRRGFRAATRSPLGLGITYSGATAIPRVVSLALLPVLTYALSPAEYGQISVALSAYTVATIIFALGLDFPVFRSMFLLSDDKPALDRFVGSVWTFLLGFPAAIAAGLSLVAAPLLWNSRVLSAPLFAISLFAAAAFVSATTVPLALLRAEERIRTYVVLTVGPALLSMALVVALVVGLRAGVIGWLAGVLTANLIAVALSFHLIPFARPQPFDATAVRAALRVSLPLLPHFSAMWGLQLADRILVAVLLSTASAGVYSLASNIALPLSVLVFGFGQGFMPSYARAARQSGNLDSLRSTIAIQIGVVAMLCSVFALLAPVAIHLLTDVRYAGAATLVPWLVVGYGFLGLYGIPMAGLTMTHGHTRGLALISLAGASVNIALILLLARTGGLEAVAIASAAGYAVLLGAVFIFAWLKHATVPYPWKRLTVVVLVAVAGYFAGVTTTGDSAPTDLLARGMWALLTVGLVGFAAVLRPDTGKRWLARFRLR